MKRVIFVLVLFIFPFLVEAQIDYQLNTLEYLNPNLLGEQLGGMYKIRESENYVLYKFDHAEYGPNTQLFDVLLFTKKTSQLSLIWPYTKIDGERINLTKSDIKGDTIIFSGSHFLKQNGMVTAFKSWFLKDSFIRETESPFSFPQIKLDTFKYFPGFNCLGKLKDSTFAFIDHTLYTTISPRTYLDAFKARKAYIYDYKAKKLQTFDFPLFNNSFKKVHEECAWVNDSFLVSGLYYDTAQSGALITGAYMADLYNRKISYKPFIVKDSTGWHQRSIVSRLAWNKHIFIAPNGYIDIYELDNQNLLVTGYNRSEMKWAKQLNNRLSRGPYPQFAKVGKGVMVLCYEVGEGFVTLRKGDGESYFTCQLHYISGDGAINQLIGEGFAEVEKLDVFFESLVEINSTTVGIFAYDRTLQKIVLKVFKMNFH